MKQVATVMLAIARVVVVGANVHPHVMLVHFYFTRSLCY